MIIYGADGYIGSMLSHLEADKTVIWMGWPSSVKAANNRPDEAWQAVNSFKKILDDLQDDERLIYASSCSVYDSVPGMQDETCNTFNLKNWYDFGKRTMDSLAQLSGKHTYGLRFATVNGWSPVLRADVMMNKMVHDAKTTGKVTVSNPQITRPVLGMSDLVRAVEAIVNSTEDNRGIFNLASFALSIEEYGRMVARKFNAELEVTPGDPTYAWGVDTSKFQKTYNFEFKDTPETVLESLDKEWEKVVVRE